ncbi:MFS transporter [Bacillus sp. MUM 13]|uniref:MDR family MFS transporter n=1 Tax=Bacillus sp. MUM 13 TaxID=1678001 RepID=UPI0008F5A7F9|nr:MFS transporter [Bacillus sp. MUM 13]OIK05538.1 hypothetical protein BIV59_21725 [Bacillus sp. MUM 13]
MKFKYFSRNIKLRLVSSFLNRIATFATIPFMAIYFTSEIGKALTGTLITISIILYFFSNLVGGYLADRFPRKKILIIGQLLHISFQAGMAICIHPSIKATALLVPLFLLNGIANNLYKPAFSAIIIDSTNTKNRKDVYTYDYWLINLSLALGTTIGGLLFKKYFFELFIISTLVLLFIAIMLNKYLIYTDPTQERIKKNIFLDLINNYTIALKDSNWIKFVVSGATIFAAEFSLGNYVGVRLSQEFHTLNLGKFELDGVRMLSTIQIENTIIILLLTFLITNFSKKFNEKRVFVTGLLMYVIGYGLVASFNHILPLLIASLIASIGELLYAPIRQAKQAELIPNNKRGSYLAFGALSNHGGSIIASLGLILGAYVQSPWISFYIISLGILGTLLVWSACYSNKEKQLKEVS